MTSARPLDNFPVLRTRDLGEACDAFERIYVRPTLVPSIVTSGFRAAVNECRLHNVRLAYSSFGAPFSLEFPASDYFFQMIALRGKASLAASGTVVPLAEGATVTISPDAGFRATYGADYECLVLKIDKRALTNKLVALTGIAIAEPLHVEPVFDAGPPAAKILLEYIPVLVDTLTNSAEPLPSWWVTQTEQLLMTMFLCAHRHNYSHLLERDVPDAARLQVRCVEEYIEAHWQEPINLEVLAEVSGVSAFSLFRSFKKVRGYSPFEFAERVRASRAVSG